MNIELTKLDGNPTDILFRRKADNCEVVFDDYFIDSGFIYLTRNGYTQLKVCMLEEDFLDFIRQYKKIQKEIQENE